jgi:hypothetical protein
LQSRDNRGLPNPLDLEDRSSGLRSRPLPPIGPEEELAKTTENLSLDHNSWSSNLQATSEESGSTRLRRDNMFIESVIAALELPTHEYPSSESQNQLSAVLRIVVNLITIGKAPTDPLLIKQDILSLSSLPSLIMKIIKGYLGN